MADYTSPYADIPSYGKGPKSVYSPEDTVSTSGFFEVILNVPQMDDDDEWGKTETIALRQVVDRINTLVQEVEDPKVTSTSGLVNQITALRKVVLLDTPVFTSSDTGGCSLSIGTTLISATSAAFGGAVSAAGLVTVAGTLRGLCGMAIQGNSTMSGNFRIDGNVSTFSLSVNGPLSIIDGSGGDASISVAGPITGDSVTTGLGTFNYLVTEAPGTATFCGAVRVEKVPKATGSGILIVDESLSVAGPITGDSVTTGVGTFNYLVTETPGTATFCGAVRVEKVPLATGSGTLIVDESIDVSKGSIETGAITVHGSSTFKAISCTLLSVEGDGYPTSATIKGVLTITGYGGKSITAYELTTLENLNVTGISHFNNVLPNATGSYNIGSTTEGFQKIYISDEKNPTGNPLAFYIKVDEGITYLCVYNGIGEKKVVVA